MNRPRDVSQCKTCLGHASATRCVSCKTMSRTWHRHRYVRASVRPCLGHGTGIDLMDELV
ncbi:Chaperone DnaJ [Gossypium arboreum]|uniref:Chaperone DnaJ n=1 Tax=Gossypium arboreum TaxID=29729 RepID=A0A0B0P1Q6_GOSAR|nr:Chaperone DnaJ [Gossypium arboreum]